jgi:hypothetical protein
MYERKKILHEDLVLSFTMIHLFLFCCSIYLKPIYMLQPLLSLTLHFTEIFDFYSDVYTLLMMYPCNTH